MLKRTQLDLLHLAFLIGLVLSWCSTPSPYYGIQFFLNIVTALGVYFLITQVFQYEHEGLWLIGILIGTGAVVSLYGLYQNFFGLEETRQFVKEHVAFPQLSSSFQSRLNSPRIFSTLVYPNTLAGYLLTLLPLSFSVLFIRKWKFYLGIVFSVSVCGAGIFLLFEKGLWITGVVLSSFFFPLMDLAAFLLTFSKGGFIVWGFVRLLAYVILYKRMDVKYRKAFFWSLFLLEALGVCFLAFKGGDLFLRLFKSSGVRWDYWQAGWAMIQDYPWWGTGPGTFGSVYARYKLPGAEETRMAHNNFLQVSSELGILTGVIFLMIWIVPWIKTLKDVFRTSLKEATSKDWIRIGAFLGVSGFFLHGMLDFDLYEPAIALNGWVLLAILNSDFLTETPASSKKTWISFPLKISFVKVTFLVLGQGVVIILLLNVRTLYQADRFYQEARGLSFKKEWDLSSKWADESLQKNPWNSQTYFLKASIAQALGDNAQAIHDYEEAYRKDPFSPVYPYHLVLTYHQRIRTKGKEVLEKCEYWLKQAIKNYPTHPELHQTAARFYESIGRLKEALIEYKEVRSLGLDTREIRHKIRKLKTIVDSKK